MKKINEILNYYFNIICLIVLSILLTGIIVLIYREFKQELKNEKQIKTEVIHDNKEIISSNIKVDIKGAVKKPGVYEIENNKNVSDLISLAGGLNKNADTSNVNLSRVLEDQMVIKIFTKNELKKQDNKEITECICPEVTITECSQSSSSITKIEENNPTASSQNPIINNPPSNNEENKLISLNTATKEQLMTLSGIGESKAVAIIEYRTTNGNFKNIEEIKNVSGIGDALFEKIKSNITI